MGAANVKAVFAHWRHLDAKPLIVLLYMANRTLDPKEGRPDRPARLYYGGRDEIAVVLNKIPEDPSEEDWRRARKIVEHHFGTLRKAGVIELMNQARMGHRAEYLLRLDDWQPPTQLGAEPPTQLAEPPTQLGAQPPTQLGAQPPTQLGAARARSPQLSRGPRSTKEDWRKKEEDNAAPSQPHLPLWTTRPTKIDPTPYDPED